MNCFRDRTNERYGRLTVIERAGHNKHGQILWKCLCDCGNITIVSSSSLKEKGGARSCGCYAREVRKSGDCRRVHGDCGKSRLYNEWKHMRKRCNNPAGKDILWYHDVSVCEEWNDYLVFKEWALSNGYRDDLSIDRIDPFGNYCPENCRWADAKTQARNKRNMQWIILDGEKYTVDEACQKCDISRALYYKRRRAGMSKHDALFTPLRKRKRKE